MMMIFLTIRMRRARKIHFRWLYYQSPNETKILLASPESLLANSIPSQSPRTESGRQWWRRVDGGGTHGWGLSGAIKNFALTLQIEPVGHLCNLTSHVDRYNGAPPHTQRPILKICQAILLSRHFSCKINLLLTCFRADTTCFHLLQVAQKYDIFSNCSSSVGREFLSNKATRSPTLKVLSHTKYT